MEHSVEVAPANSLVLIIDPTAGDLPPSMAGKLVAATPECIAVGTRSEADGATLLTLADADVTQLTRMELVFSGRVQTPSLVLCLRSVLGEVFLTIPVVGTAAHVRVWVNDASEPDHLVVVAQPPRESEG